MNSVRCAFPRCPLCADTAGILHGVDDGYGSVSECDACGGAQVIHACMDCGAPFASGDELHERRPLHFVCGRCDREAAETMVPPAPDTIPAPGWAACLACDGAGVVEGRRCPCVDGPPALIEAANDGNGDRALLAGLTQSLGLVEDARAAGIEAHEAFRVVRQAIAGRTGR